MTDPRQDLSTIWKALDRLHDKVLFIDGETPEHRRAWDDICEAMARIAESLGYDPVEIAAND
jgi:hypothetical protein